jgi:hypothetical protein
MEKTEILPRFFVQLVPIRSNSFEQAESAHNIGLDKGFRTVNGPINVAFRGKMYHGARSIAPKKVTHEDGISDIAPNEDVPLVPGKYLQIFKVARITEYVEVNHCLIGLRQPVQYEICPDEPSSSRY